MREFKFRGKLISTNEWVYGSLINNAFTKYSKPVYYIFDETKIEYDCWEDIAGYLDEFEVYPETVGQFTGIIDENGQDVCEGDIVKYYEFNEETQEVINMGIGAVYFDDNYEGNYTIKGEEPNSLGRYLIVIVGNIYENKELLNNVPHREDNN